MTPGMNYDICDDRLDSEVTNMIRYMIRYKGPVFVGRASVTAKPVIGSLHSTDCVCRLADLLAVGLALFVSRDSTCCRLCSVFQALRSTLRLLSVFRMETGDSTPADDRSGITFAVELAVMWNAPEAQVQLDLDSVCDLETVPDVLACVVDDQMCLLSGSCLAGILAP